MQDNPLLSYTSTLFDLSSFVEEFGEVCLPGGTKSLPEGKHRLSKRDCEVLLKWLNRDCGVVVWDGSVSLELLAFNWGAAFCACGRELHVAKGIPLITLQMVKILEDGELASEHEISEADRGTLAILQTLKKVDAQIADIEQQINTSVSPLLGSLEPLLANKCPWQRG